MGIIRWDPFGELEGIQSRLNRLIGDRGDAPVFADWTPAVDIEETETFYLLKADLPDVKRENVKVSFYNGLLTLEGERNLEKEEQSHAFHKIERAYGKFVRRFALPSEIDPNNVTATFKDGVLNVRVPKTVAAAKKTIEVKVA